MCTFWSRWKRILLSRAPYCYWIHKNFIIFLSASDENCPTWPHITLIIPKCRCSFNIFEHTPHQPPTWNFCLSRLWMCTRFIRRSVSTPFYRSLLFRFTRSFSLDINPLIIFSLSFMLFKRLFFSIRMILAGKYPIDA